MSQILNRLYNFAKSHINYKDDEYKSYLNTDTESDELRRIIDELNNPKQNKNSRQSGSKSTESQSSPLNPLIANAYKTLDLSPDSSIEQIKKAYKLKIKIYHPDKINGTNPEEKQKTIRMAQEINKAYTIIKQYKGF